MAAVTVIKLTGNNHSDIDRVASHIRAICEQSDTKLRGPIPLPTRRLVVLFDVHLTVKEAKLTIIGNYVFTSVCWKCTSILVRMKPLCDKLQRLTSLIQ